MRALLKLDTYLLKLKMPRSSSYMCLQTETYTASSSKEISWINSSTPSRWRAVLIEVLAKAILKKLLDSWCTGIPKEIQCIQRMKSMKWFLWVKPQRTAPPSTMICKTLRKETPWKQQLARFKDIAQRALKPCKTKTWSSRGTMKHKQNTTEQKCFCSHLSSNSDSFQWKKSLRWQYISILEYYNFVIHLLSSPSLHSLYPKRHIPSWISFRSTKTSLSASMKDSC